MNSMHGVVLLTDIHDEEEIIRVIHTRADTLKVVRRCADLAEVIAAARSGIADLALIRGNEPDLDANAVSDMLAAGMSVVALAGAKDTRRLMSLGVTSVVPPGSPERAIDSLMASVHRPMRTHALPPPPPPEGGKKGHIIAVWGTSGAPGRSTIAAALACTLASVGKSLLVDADLSNPSIAHMLSLPADTSGLVTLMRRASRGLLCPEDVAAIAHPRAKDFSILTGLITAHRWREISEKTLSPFLEVLREEALHSVIDLGATHLEKSSRDRDELTHSFLARADRVIIVARGDIVGLGRLARLRVWWEENNMAVPADIVINRVSDIAVGPRPASALQGALATFLEGEHFHIIPEDKAVVRDLLRGRVLGEKGKATPASLAVKQLAHDIASTL